MTSWHDEFEAEEHDGLAEEWRWLQGRLDEMEADLTVCQARACKARKVARSARNLLVELDTHLRVADWLAANDACHEWLTEQGE